MENILTHYGLKKLTIGGFSERSVWIENQRRNNFLSQHLNYSFSANSGKIIQCMRLFSISVMRKIQSIFYSLDFSLVRFFVLRQRNEQIYIYSVTILDVWKCYELLR